MIRAQIRKRLGSFSLDAAFEAGEETVVLFGHSGSGKSLTLASIAGLVRPEAGRIEVGGRVVFDAERGIDLPPQQRGVGYVVQDLALFPHLSAADNIGYGLVGWSRAEREGRVRTLVEMFRLEGLEDRPPRALSGGQQQRVALARALAPRPRVLLLDEPFSALDATIRQALRRELLRWRTQWNLTVVFVTHDLREGYQLADRLVIFDGGRVVDAGPRDRVFHRPANRRAAELTEFHNVWRGRVLAQDGDATVVEVAGAQVRAPRSDLAAGRVVDVGIRPDRVLLIRREPPPGAADTHLSGTLVEETAQGATHSLQFAIGESALRVEVEIAAHPYEVLGVSTRRQWWLQLRRSAVHLMPAPDAGPPPLP